MNKLNNIMNKPFKNLKETDLKKITVIIDEYYSNLRKERLNILNNQDQDIENKNINSFFEKFRISKIEFLSKIVKKIYLLSFQTKHFDYDEILNFLSFCSMTLTTLEFLTMLQNLFQDKDFVDREIFLQCVCKIYFTNQKIQYNWNTTKLKLFESSCNFELKFIGNWILDSDFILNIAAIKLFQFILTSENNDKIFKIVENCINHFNDKILKNTKFILETIKLYSKILCYYNNNQNSSLEFSIKESISFLSNKYTVLKGGYSN